MLSLSELPSPSSSSLLPRDPFLNPQDTPPPPPPPAPQTHRQSPRPALRSRPTECQAARLWLGQSLEPPCWERRMVQSLVHRPQRPGSRSGAREGQGAGSRPTGALASSPPPTGRFPTALTPPPAGRPPPRPGATPGPYPQTRRPHFPADLPGSPLPLLILAALSCSYRHLPGAPTPLPAASRVVSSLPQTPRGAKVPARPGIATPSPSLLSRPPSSSCTSGKGPRSSPH